MDNTQFNGAAISSTVFEIYTALAASAECFVSDLVVTHDILILSTVEPMLLANPKTSTSFNLSYSLPFFLHNLLGYFDYFFYVFSDSDMFGALGF